MKKLLIICLLAVFTFSLAGSISAAAPTVRQLTTKEAIFNQFKQDLGNRSNLLNSTTPRRTGSYGLYDFFITQGKITPAIFNDTLVPAITGKHIIELSVFERLSWFKDQFIANASVFDIYDKAGVERAVKARLIDLKLSTFEKSSKISVKAIKDAFNRTLSGRTVVADPVAGVAVFESLITLRKKAIALCEGNYRNNLAGTGTISPNPDSTEFGRYMANLSILQAKDSCVNTAWTAFYTSGLTLPAGQTGPTNVAAAITVANSAYNGVADHSTLVADLAVINTAWANGSSW